MSVCVPGFEVGVVRLKHLLQERVEVEGVLPWLASLDLYTTEMESPQALSLLCTITG